MGIYRNNNGVIENLTPTAPPAIGIQYDNTDSGLTADNVQDAIDEVNGNLIDCFNETTTPILTPYKDANGRSIYAVCVSASIDVSVGNQNMIQVPIPNGKTLSNIIDYSYMFNYEGVFIKGIDLYSDGTISEFNGSIDIRPVNDGIVWCVARASASSSFKCRVMYSVL